jgi:hypothetical protein
MSTLKLLKVSKYRKLFMLTEHFFQRIDQGEFANLKRDTCESKSFY